MKNIPKSQNITKSLATLLAGITFVDPDVDCDIHGLSIDSRQIKPGDLFIAYPGEKSDGRDFIQEAFQKGAVAVLAENNDQKIPPAPPFAKGGIPSLCIDEKLNTKPLASAAQSAAKIDFDSEHEGSQQNDLSRVVPPFVKGGAGGILLKVVDVQYKVSHIASRFYDHPSRRLHITGVTGTNGKTSIAYLLACAQNAFHDPSVYFGTLGIGFPEALQETTHTTLDPIHLQESLATFVHKNVTHAALEVSSHALEQGRVAHIEFETAVFTNLTRDHLDYHKTMEAYGKAKAKLFQQFGLKSAVINQDDPFGLTLYQSLSDEIFRLGYSIKNPNSEIYADNISITHQGIQANLKTPWGEGQLKTPLIGYFNLYNILAVIGVLGLSYPIEKILTCLETLPHVPGRMECITSPTPSSSFIVDYAHTPDALKNVLMTAKELLKNTPGKLWCVFGCGGDRDKGKRSEMGKIAQILADHIIITNDNPRTEDPQIIANDIIQGLSSKKHLTVILDRKAAITHAYNQAKDQDIILIAGKGHEPYQIIGTEKHYFSDQAVCTTLVS